MGDGKDRRSYQAGNKFHRTFTWAEIGKFKKGKWVWWKDGGKWYEGRVANTVQMDATGAQYITVVNTDVSTRNVATGETTRVYPGGIKRR
jgi:hypothetical protein